ncbi:MAG: thymidylate kinase [Candidatus Methanofastidiosum methylothiophilum]|uniref:dTMP kinase n=1 Tax=Candidatus Methanofastidiosum methylothiophilum TaxID=1705564 RepID=A0A150IX82_9EURY|nr:MAG: thymidylate kinase [Candidatus Methanofastidiosum methylthiophilus]KYC47154.1 MAG: thymidylate kinase [Candidatus Methanofastidiosum methylthiophilus]KYC49570.1 MAG: thymidylate kinase [Candidatus Methanofastidiosum methylthiophilus]
MRLIIVDGLDGAGKDTHANLIRNRYINKGDKVILRSHPENDNTFGIKAKDSLLGEGKLNYIKASIYYAFDVIRSVRKYYKKGEGTLIVVRYLMGVAYLPLPLAKFFYKFFSTILPTSEYMFFLDVEPEESLRRLSKRNEKEMFENLEDLVKVREKALKLADNWNIINTCYSIEEVQKQIEIVLDNLDNGKDKSKFQNISNQIQN